LNGVACMEMHSVGKGSATEGEEERKGSFKEDTEIVVGGGGGTDMNGGVTREPKGEERGNSGWRESRAVGKRRGRMVQKKGEGINTELSG